MEVKIYREPENEGIILNEDDLRSYTELTEELGIECSVKEGDTPNVYVPINTTASKCFKELCPSSIEYKKYSYSTIPVEVLKVIKYAEDNKMFDAIFICWDDKSPDPMVIGKTYKDEEDRKNNYTWNMNEFLIARWGDCAKEFDELVSDGMDRIAERLSFAASEIEANISIFRKDPKGYVKQSMGGFIQPFDSRKVSSNI